MIEEYAVTMLKFVEIKKRLSIETNYKGYFPYQTQMILMRKIKTD